MTADLRVRQRACSGFIAPVAICALGTIGCASVVTTVRVPEANRSITQHAIFVGENGRAASIVNERWQAMFRADSSGGKAPPEVSETISYGWRVSPEHSMGVTAFVPRAPGPGSYNYDEYLARLVQSIRDSGKRRILLYFHGGRVSLASGLRHSIDDAAELSGTEYYPIFINWESGDGTSYWSHIAPRMTVRQGQPPVETDSAGLVTRSLMRGIVRPAYGLVLGTLLAGESAIGASVTLVGDVGRGASLFPALVQKELWREMRAASEATRLESRIDTLRQAGLGPHVWFQPVVEPAWKPLVRLGTLPYRVAIRAPITTVVAVFGIGEWESMRTSAKAMVRPADEAEVAEGGVGFVPPTGALGKLVAKLGELCKEMPDLEVVAVAHSTGATVLSECLQARPTMRVSRIVFLAAACSIREFRDRVIPYLADHPRTKFYSLCLNPIDELSESYPPGIGPFLYSGSLLTWLDDYLGERGDFLDRTLGRSENIMNALHIIPDSVRDRVYIKVFSGDRSAELDGGAKRHSEVTRPTNGMRYWQPNYWWPLSEPEKRPRRTRDMQSRGRLR